MSDTPNDVRAAAERLRRLTSEDSPFLGESPEDVYPNCPSTFDPVLADAATVSRAYIREHPADGGTQTRSGRWDRTTQGERYLPMSDVINYAALRAVLQRISFEAASVADLCTEPGSYRRGVAAAVARSIRRDIECVIATLDHRDKELAIDTAAAMRSSP